MSGGACFTTPFPRRPSKRFIGTSYISTLWPRKLMQPSPDLPIPMKRRLCLALTACRWLQVSLRSTVRELAAAKVQAVCVVPISFVSDHVEILGEIDHEARDDV